MLIFEEHQKNVDKRVKQHFYREALGRQVEQKHKLQVLDDRKWNAHPLGPNYEQAQSSYWQSTRTNQHFRSEQIPLQKRSLVETPASQGPFQMSKDKVKQALTNLRNSRLTPDAYQAQAKAKNLKNPNGSNPPQRGGGFRNNSSTLTGKEGIAPARGSSNYAYSLRSYPGPKNKKQNSGNKNNDMRQQRQYLPYRELKLPNYRGPRPPPKKNGPKNVGPEPNTVSPPPPPSPMPQAYPYPAYPPYAHPVDPAPSPASYPEFNCPRLPPKVPMQQQSLPIVNPHLRNQGQNVYEGRQKQVQDHRSRQTIPDSDANTNSSGDSTRFSQFTNSLPSPRQDGNEWNTRKSRSYQHQDRPPPPPSNYELHPSNSTRSNFESLKEFIEDKLMDGTVNFDELRESVFGKPNSWRTSDNEVNTKVLKDIINRAELAQQIEVNRLKRAEQEAKEKAEEERLDRKIQEYSEAQRMRLFETSQAEMQRNLRRAQKVVTEDFARSQENKRSNQSFGGISSRKSPERRLENSKSEHHELKIIFPVDPERSLARKLRSRSRSHGRSSGRSQDGGAAGDHMKPFLQSPSNEDRYRHRQMSSFQFDIPDPQITPVKNRTYSPPIPTHRPKPTVYSDETLKSALKSKQNPTYRESKYEIRQQRKAPAPKINPHDDAPIPAARSRAKVENTLQSKLSSSTI